MKPKERKQPILRGFPMQYSFSTRILYVDFQCKFHALSLRCFPMLIIVKTLNCEISIIQALIDDPFAPTESLRADLRGQQQKVNPTVHKIVVFFLQIQ